MSAPGVASNYTRVPAGSTDTLINEGGTIKVCSIIISASLVDGVVTITEADGSTVIVTLRALANTTVEVRNSFIASRGIAVTTDAASTCTLFHSNVGS